MKALNIFFLAAAIALCGAQVWAQTSPAAPGQWRKVTPATPTTQAAQPADTTESNAVVSAPDPGQDSSEATEPETGNAQTQATQQPAAPAPPTTSGDGWTRFGGRQAEPPRPPMPSSMTIPAGTWITMRVNQPISSNHNQAGDAFMGTLAEPLVVNGLVLARRGQTVLGRVTEAKKGGRVKGTSQLGLELTELALADGQQVNVHTQMMVRQGHTSVGRDATAIGTTTAMGAAIGAAADDGFGAGMGAIAGAGASIIGVLVTRGRATVVYPETPLTFRLTGATVVHADFNNEAFVPVTQEDYAQASLQRRGPARRPPSLYYGAYPYYAPYPYWGSYYGSYWGPGWGYGPSIGFYYGGGFRGYRGGFHGHGGFHGRGGGHGGRGRR